MISKIKIGVSSCLLGQKVRFDGQHKYHWYINEVLGKYFEYMPICPEAEAGMGIPRKTVRLVGPLKDPNMLEPHSGEDWTERINKLGLTKVKMLGDLSGYLFKKGSPSCGVFRVKVYQKNGIPLANGQGLFAKQVMQAYPLLPVEEEGRLNDHKLRENFLERVFGYHRLQCLSQKRFRRGDWVKFHQDNKFLLLSHGRKLYTELGQLVANIKDYKPREFFSLYSKTYMEALSTKTTIKKNVDTLMHILGFLKKHLNGNAKTCILNEIENYRCSIHPLIVPVSLLKHYIEMYEVEYIKDQTYLNPHPFDLSLRNHV
ncbi:MAG: YbgA family protein [Oligoflexales bacterium]